MPFIDISVSGTTLSAVQKQRIFDETTRLMSEVMGKVPSLTSVRVGRFSADGWAVGGKSVAARGEIAVHMDIKITKGTNTDEEKAEMIRQGLSMLKDVVGETSEAGYVVIHELDASSWGYDGKTQFFRVGTRMAAA